MNIIKFPGVRSTAVGPAQPGPDAPPSFIPDEKPNGQQPPRRQQIQLNPGQQKALAIITSGKPFIVIGLSPTDSGCDFHTVAEGDADVLRNAEQHLEGVISRLYVRIGIR